MLILEQNIVHKVYILIKRFYSYHLLRAMASDLWQIVIIQNI